MTKCRRCKRNLKSKESVAKEYGPTCYRKMMDKSQEKIDKYM